LLQPFYNLPIKPDGKISLCCNDALGKMTMGDLSKEGVLDIWLGSKYQQIRKAMLKGRKFISLCSSCDAFV
jgi:radical SAM protein with 4Fe4S-binding SPASM domain